MTARRDETRWIDLSAGRSPPVEATHAGAPPDDLFSFALDAAGLGAWELDLVDHTAHRSLEHDRIFGYEQLLPEWSWQRFLEHVLPGDRPHVERRFRAVVEDGGEWISECRIARRDGEIRWIRVAGRLRTDARGRRRMAGVVQDVTDRKRADEILRETGAREAFFSQLADALRPLTAADEIMAVACRALGEFLRLDRVYYSELLWRQQTGRVRADYVLGDLPSMIGLYPMAEHTETIEVIRRGEPFFVGDVERAPGMTEATRALCRARGVASYGLLPLVRNHEPVWSLTVASSRPRAWTAAEVAVIAGVAERTWAAVKRGEAEEWLREEDRRRSHFLAMLSHELRNPLAPIRNSLYILDRAAPDGEQARRAREVIARQVDQLSRLVDDLLDVTRVTRGRIQLQRRRLELGELVRHTLEDHRTLFEEAQLEVGLAPAPSPLFVDADASRVAQVLGNLLENAAKFTPRGGRVAVAVSAEAEARRAVVRVADTGVGMTPELLARLFEPFVQADATLDRSQGGLGLGLALARTLVELHGGSVEARSEGTGRGTEITVRLPLDEATPVVAAPEPPSARATRRLVLIIEDNRDAADSLREIVEMHGHEAVVAYDGPGGIAAAREHRPELVLCDIGLPLIDGYTVARTLRADAALAGVHLIALSGYALPEDRERAAEAGFDRHLSKPINLETLSRILASSLIA